MSLRLRVLLSVVGLVFLTVVGAWMVAGGAVLRPLVGELATERADTAIFAARRLASVPVDERRDVAHELSRDLGIRMRLLDELPEPRGRGQGEPRVYERDGYTLYTVRGPHAPILVGMGASGGPPFLAVHFSVDLDQPQRNVGLGLVVIFGVAISAAVAASRWMLSPLEVASDAMQRVADGDLAHRVQAGTDAAGRIGATFNRMAARVQGLVDGQRELMAAVSHELRTPLTRMRLQAELLREQGADERRVQALEADIAEVDALVGELLESARLHQGQLALKVEELRLADLIDEVVAAADLGARSVTVQVPDDLVLAGDRTRLRRVVANLLSNVSKYTPTDAAVEVAAQALPGEVVLTVADRGPGVPEDALDRLFDPFFRAEGSRSRRTGGLGLGLMLVRQVVEAHGGSVRAENREGGGLCITCRLPRRA